MEQRCKLLVVLFPSSFDTGFHLFELLIIQFFSQHVSKPESLSQRLICVNISEVNLGLVSSILNAIASVASFINYLVLADRVRRSKRHLDASHVYWEAHTPPPVLTLKSRFVPAFGFSTKKNRGTTLFSFILMLQQSNWSAPFNGK